MGLCSASAVTAHTALGIGTITVNRCRPIRRRPAVGCVSQESTTCHRCGSERSAQFRCLLRDVVPLSQDVTMFRHCRICLYGIKAARSARRGPDSPAAPLTAARPPHAALHNLVCTAPSHWATSGRFQAADHTRIGTRDEPRLSVGSHSLSRCWWESSRPVYGTAVMVAPVAVCNLRVVLA